MVAMFNHGYHISMLPWLSCCHGYRGYPGYCGYYLETKNHQSTPASSSQTLFLQGEEVATAPKVTTDETALSVEAREPVATTSGYQHEPQLPGTPDSQIHTTVSTTNRR